MLWNRRTRHSLPRAPEVEEWRRIAATLSARERLAPWWSNLTGRAVADPRLAAAAVARGRATQALSGSPVPGRMWLWRATGLLWLVVGILDVADGRWFDAATKLVIGALLAGLPELTRFDRAQVQRSIEANRRLVSSPPS